MPDNFFGASEKPEAANQPIFSPNVSGAPNPNSNVGSVPSSSSFPPVNPSFSSPTISQPSVSPFGTVPSEAPIPPSAPEQKFAPPPPNIFIRTSASDLENIKSAGGEIPAWQPPTTPPPSLSQMPPAFGEPTFNPNPEISAAELTNFPQTQPPHKNKIVPLLIIIGIIIAAGALGYFFLWPKLFGPKTVTPPTTQPVEVPTTILTTTTTLPPSPYPQISEPYQKNVIDLKIQGSLVVSALKEEATKEMAPAQTFKILIPRYHDYLLSGEEVILSLIPNLPESLKPYLLGRKYLVYVYYGEVNPSLGLIIEIGQSSKEEVKGIFATWEKGKILTDLSNFWLIKTPKKVAQTFKSETVNGAEIRYLTYSGKEAALSYGFFGDYLILTSSRESLNSAVTHLQGATVPIYP